MKLITNPQHFSFTNHFNQSLLKTRIEMMNRRKSSFKAVFKYGFFIALIWLSAAFTKPYRQEIALKIAEKMPELKPVLAPSKEILQSQSTEIEKVSQNVPVSKTKYVVYKDDKLYWVVTPKVTLNDLTAIQQEFKKAGGVFFVKQMKYDPLGVYLSEITIKTSYAKGGGSGQTDDLKAIDKPISSFGGWINPKNRSCGISDNSWDPVFNKIVEQDTKEIEKLINDHQTDSNKAKKEEKNRQDESFFYDARHKFYSNPLKTPNGLTILTQEALQYIFQTCARNRIYFEEEGEFRVENLYKNAEFIVNNQPSSLQQAELLTFDKIRAVACYTVYSDSTRQSARRTVAIVTHNYSKP
ncbi:hypothetical protein [Runella sp.]|uniref:hypothetical protein n=1 Tax=Runella sp. TaxID=1960881 RepID=UPI003D128C96